MGTKATTCIEIYISKWICSSDNFEAIKQFHVYLKNYFCEELLSFHQLIH